MAGADAILLIVAALEPRELAEPAPRGARARPRRARRGPRRARAGRARWSVDPDVIGINNRDLTDFSVDIERTFELLADVPAGKTVVSESGFTHARAARRARARRRRRGARRRDADARRRSRGGAAGSWPAQRTSGTVEAGRLLARVHRGSATLQAPMTTRSLALPLAAAVLGGAVAAARPARRRGRRRHDDDGRPAGAARRPRTPRPSSAGGLTAREIYKRDAPGVVFVRAEVVQQTQSPFDASRASSEATRPARASSSTATATSSPTPTSSRARREVTVQFADNRRSTAEVVGKDASTDLALLKVDPDGPRPPPAGARRSSKDVQVGDPTIAIGNPFGLDRTLTTGVVSRAPAPDQGAERLRDQRRHPDRRGDQPRQLRRPAARRDRPRHRHQLADRHRRRRRRQRRHRLRRADRHGQADPPRAQGRRAASSAPSSASRGVTIDERSLALNLPVDKRRAGADGRARQPGRQGRHARRRRRGDHGRRPARRAGRRHHHRGRRPRRSTAMEDVHGASSVKRKPGDKVDDRACARRQDGHGQRGSSASARAARPPSSTPPTMAA